MRPNDEKKIRSLLAEIAIMSKDLPPWKYRKIANRCDKITMVIKKQTDNHMEKYNAKKAILNALLQGRHLSQMDCAEFMVEDMRSVVSHLKEKFEDTHELKTKWIKTPLRRANIKEYWLERRTQA